MDAETQARLLAAVKSAQEAWDAARSQADQDRRSAVRAAADAGVPVELIAAEMLLSRQRVYQIIRGIR